MSEEVITRPRQALGANFSVVDRELRFDLSGSGFEFRMNDVDPDNGEYPYLIYVMNEYLYRGWMKVPVIERSPYLRMSKSPPQGTATDRFDQRYQLSVGLIQNPSGLNLPSRPWV